MATSIERNRAREKALHDKLDAILEAVLKRNEKEVKDQSKKSKVIKKTK